jgi:hypothetical protein
MEVCPNWPALRILLVMEFPAFGTIHPCVVNEYRDIQPKGIVAAISANLLLLSRFLLFIWKVPVHLVSV